FSIDACTAEVEMAKMTYKNLAGSRMASAEEIRKAALEAKRLEVKLAAAKLAQSEYYLSSLMARADFLEARCAQGSAVKREREELAWIREALPINKATIARLSMEMEKQRRELDALQNEPLLAESA
ncbi:MAG TPA: hypothetical protein VID27_17445, partial [Blastocatellia bacterium]